MQNLNNVVKTDALTDRSIHRHANIQYKYRYSNYILLTQVQSQTKSTDARRYCPSGRADSTCAIALTQSHTQIINADNGNLYNLDGSMDRWMNG